MPIPENAGAAASRHLLRALLRECTYLPDPHARIYLPQHIKRRFRAYTPAQKSLPLIEARREANVADAKQALSQLRRANAGQLRPLHRVLLLTYGRTGRRRREMLAPLLLVPGGPVEEEASSGGGSTPGPTSTSSTPEQSPEDAAAPQSSSKSSKSSKSSSKTSKSSDGAAAASQPFIRIGHALAHPAIAAAAPKLTPALQALLSSQVRDSPPVTIRKTAKAKHLSPQIPESNAWGRAMPQVRVKNMASGWYADVLARAVPPLPEHLWTWLMAHALGEAKFKGEIPRRKRAEEKETETVVGEEDKAKEVLERELGVRGEWDGAQDVVQTVERRLEFGPRPMRQNRHTLTPRFMRRAWAYVFGQSCRMEWHAATGDEKGEKGEGKWTVEWGSQVMARDLRRKQTRIVQ